MNDPEGFLSRWARRKRAVQERESDQVEAARPRESGDPELDSRLGGNERNVDSELSQDRSPSSRGDEDEKAGETEPEFDLSKLPSIDSITAETDIRPFFARGVPADLRQAALRRAWVADPHIRDFIGIAENQGNFTGAGDMPGFDFSPPTGDVARMIAEVFGENRSGEAVRSEEPATTSSETKLTEDETGDHRNVTPAVEAQDVRGSELPSELATGDETVRRTVLAERIDDNGAPQKDNAVQEEKIPVRRSHGGAMPK